MSNPAAITLGEVNVKSGKFRVEDSIGEAIHIYLADFRFDLSISEFRKLAYDVYMALQIYFQDIPGFELDIISREFLFRRAECWKDLIMVKKEITTLSSLLVDTKGAMGIVKYADISKLRHKKVLDDSALGFERRKENNYYGQTNQERLDMILGIMKKEGYDEKKGSIVLFNNKNNIMDGQYRAACLYYLNGDMSVPVIRMFFEKNKYNAVSNPLFVKIFKWNRKKYAIVIRKINSKMKRALLYFKIKIYGLAVRFDKIRYRV